MLIYEHFRYRFDYLLATNDAKSWRCVNCNAGCKGRITTLGESVLTSDTFQNHPEEPAENEAYEIRASIRERAVSTFESPRQILQRCENNASQETTAFLPSYKAPKICLNQLEQIVLNNPQQNINLGSSQRNYPRGYFLNLFFLKLRLIYFVMLCFFCSNQLKQYQPNL